jgi:chromatin remodeling complex protein RSC6
MAKKVNPALMMKLTPTSALAEIIGSKPTPRGQAIKGV